MLNGAQPLHFTDQETEVQRGVWLAQDSRRLAVWADPAKVQGTAPQPGAHSVTVPGSWAWGRQGCRSRS